MHQQLSLKYRNHFEVYCPQRTPPRGSWNSEWMSECLCVGHTHKALNTQSGQDLSGGLGVLSAVAWDTLFSFVCNLLWCKWSPTSLTSRTSSLRIYRRVKNVQPYLTKPYTTFGAIVHHKFVNHSGPNFQQGSSSLHDLNICFSVLYQSWAAWDSFATFWSFPFH